MTPNALARLIPMLVLACVACAGIRVNQDYDPSIDFRRLQTYSWIPGPQPKTGDLRLDSPLIDTRVRAAIDRSLAERGYQKLAEGIPDFLVGYHLSMDQKLDVRTTDTYYGYGAGYGRYGRGGVVGFNTTVQQYDEGTIIIDIANGANDRLIWRGWGAQRLRRDPSPEQTTRAIDRAVIEILKQFPPR
jgi:hypothetical protein